MTAICARTERSRAGEPVEVLLEIVDRDLLRDDAAERGELHDRLLHLVDRNADDERRAPCSPVATFALTTWPPSDSVRSSAFWAARETPSEFATSTVSVALIRWARSTWVRSADRPGVLVGRHPKVRSWSLALLWWAGAASSGRRPPVTAESGCLLKRAWQRGRRSAREPERPQRSRSRASGGGTAGRARSRRRASEAAAEKGRLGAAP